MKRLKIKLTGLWHLLWCDEWLIHTINRGAGYSYRGESMIVADIIDYCADKHNTYYNEVIDRAQADANLKTVNKILNN